MVRTVCCALLALFATSGTALPQGFRHRHIVYFRPVYPAPHFYGSWPIWLGHPYTPLPYVYQLPSPAPDYTLPAPSYLFVGSAAVSYPQLVFQDGTIYTVADYWRENDDLHFITVEGGGTKFVPHTAPLGDLDLDQTKDRAKAQGFQFILRDKPIEQWLEDRAQKRSARSADGEKR